MLTFLPLVGTQSLPSKQSWQPHHPPTQSTIRLSQFPTPILTEMPQDQTLSSLHPNPLHSPPSRASSVLTLLHQETAMQTKMKEPTISTMTPPPSPICHSPTTHEDQKQQDPPVKQEDLVSPVPLQFFQVSRTFLCHPICLGCVARPPALGDLLPLSFLSSHTPQYPLSLQESMIPPLHT